MARHLYRFFLPQAVKRSLNCEWSEEEGGVTSREETSAMLALEIDHRYNFDSAVPAAQATMERTIDTAILPPPQYQQRENDSISTFGTVKHTSQPHNKSPANSVSTTNTNNTHATAKNKRRQSHPTMRPSEKSTTSKGSKASHTTRSIGEDTSALTSSVDLLATNVKVMEQQIMAIMLRFDAILDHVPKQPPPSLKPDQKGEGSE